MAGDRECAARAQGSARPLAPCHAIEEEYDALQILSREKCRDLQPSGASLMGRRERLASLRAEAEAGEAVSWEGDALHHEPEAPPTTVRVKVDPAGRPWTPAQLDRAFRAADEDLRVAEDDRLKALYAGAGAADVAALCFSGGGIRSATFNLGILQSLAGGGLLDRFHYLSTVSGGGYIGSWLTAWIHREPEGLPAVCEQLKGGLRGPEHEPGPIRHLRDYSNYLSPRLSLLSADSWMLVATYVRNLVLNWLVLISLLAAVLAVPRLCVQAVVHLPELSFDDRGAYKGPAGLFVGLGLLLAALPCLALAVAYMNRHAPSLRGQYARSEPNDEPRFLIRCLLPLLVGAILCCTAWPCLRPVVGAPGANPSFGSWNWRWAFGFVAFGLIWQTSAWLLNVPLRSQPTKKSRHELAAMAVAGAAGTLLLYVLMTLDWTSPRWHARAFVCLGLPAFLVCFLFSLILFRAFTIRISDDEDREWAARSAGWSILALAVWATTSGLALLGPSGLVRLYEWSAAGAGAVGVAGTLAGVVTAWLGKSSRTPATPERAAAPAATDWLRRYALPVAAAAFVVFLAVLVSLGTTWLTTKVKPELAYRPPARRVVAPAAVGVLLPTFVPPAEPRHRDWHYRVLTDRDPDRRRRRDGDGWWIPLALAGAFIAVGLGMSHFVSVNKFSLHTVYRNRLIRAYLGASRADRDWSPTLNPFTGFDEQDNLRLHEVAEDVRVVDAAALAGHLREPAAAAAELSAFLRGRMPKATALLRTGTAGCPPPATFAATSREELAAVVKAAELGDGREELTKALTAAGAASLPAAGDRVADRLEAALGGAIRVRRMPPRLFHVVNIALNLVAGGKLAWQQRKAESFTATPLHCGCPQLGYRPSAVYGGGIETGPGGRPARLTPGQAISLGTALSVSGAAASPNMGYASSAPLAALLALFNVRLGLWLGNPGPPGSQGLPTHGLAHPRISVRPLLEEAFGRTDDKHPYVYLSDGGHFDNLGLYEMVRRRCRTIVVCDAGADPDGAFDDLGNALRKIYIDLGVRIEFDGPIPIYSRAAAEKLGRLARDHGYHAVGTIRYPDGGEAENGRLIYVKAAYYGGGEPAAVSNYARRWPDFPHEATADQFFSESQFESYRALGKYVGDIVANEVFLDAAEVPTPDDLAAAPQAADERLPVTPSDDPVRDTPDENGDL